MPTYEYICDNCGRFERFEKITATPLKECPTCKGEVKRVISAPAVIFKGSGFYTTDNRSKDYNQDQGSTSTNSCCDSACACNE